MTESAPQFAYQPPAYFPVPFHLQNAYLTVPQVTTTSVAAAASSSVAPIIGPVYPAAYSLPQYQQAQQLFQKDAQIITREGLAIVKAAIASSTIEQKLETKKNAIPRKAAGKSWEDPTLADWPEKSRGRITWSGNRSAKNGCMQICLLDKEMIWNMMIFDCSVEILAMKSMMTFLQRHFPNILLSTWQDSSLHYQLLVGGERQVDWEDQRLWLC
ncbi:hypothetical protein OPV22_030596 [Ensete ventricosum]|uniref:RNA-binding protein 42-like n=1 Tax=Ensete ventricosum TaxID=4639 RepID=A0AAV8Q987_ENSVE|nr:hypothetical protein OPV22_030596 [Ensete ventricosum]